MSTRDRVRTTSTFEEANIDGFVQATINFKTNCDFVSFNGADSKFEGSHILFLAQGAEAATKAFSALTTYFTEDVKASLTDGATDGKVFAVGTIAGKRVLVGLVPTQASRHNCAARPDVITSIVSEALGDGKKVTGLDIVSAYDNTWELAVSQAVAKASHSFSSKNGLWEKGYAKELTKVVTHLQSMKNTAADLSAVAESIQVAARLVDAPTNLLDTTTYPEICRGMAKRFGFSCSVIEGEALREQGYGGLYGVGKAAEFPAALVTLSYKPQDGATAEKIALVGKGMVYDCGGLSIKTPTPNMCGMKDDMGGSAAVFGGFLAAVRCRTPHPMDCVLCIADNAISARAQRNDDIVIFKSGRTCQINNTDAEGRLILSDGVYHAAKCCGAEPALIIDMATLTGAQGISTGHNFAALYTPQDSTEKQVIAASRKSSDLCFPMLYMPESHTKEFACKGSDHKNSVANRSNAQSSCAAHFIEANLPKDYKGRWAHIDMAYPAVNAELGTGFGVALLASMFAPQFQK